MAELSIHHGRILLPDGRLVSGDLAARDGKIVAIGEGLPAGEVAVDAGGAYVLPGLIDLHLHGMGFESAYAESLEALAALEAAQGATTIIPTLFGPPEATMAALRRHRRTTDELRALPQVAGFRLESPYLAQTGAGISQDLAPISPELTLALLDAGGGRIKIWDISPELPGAVEAIALLSAQGVVCSLAHTRASIAQARAAIDAGARLVTHLFDTFEVPEMTDPGVYPVGLVDYLLTEDRVTCEIIPDGTHVHPLLVEKAIRCKPDERLVFVTDSNFGAGLPAGDYDLPQGWGRARITDANNGVRLLDRGMTLAGSALTPFASFVNALRLFQQDLARAVRLCAATPARLLGLRKGELRVGYDADVILVSEGLELMRTIVAGRVVWG